VLRAGGIKGEIAVAAGALNPISAAAIATAAALRVALGSFMEWEQSLVNIGRVADFSTQQMRVFGEAIDDISKQLPVGTQELFEIADAAANAGLAGPQLAGFVAEMAKLKSILPGLNENQTRGILAIADLTGFPIESVGELNAKLLRLEQVSKATLPSLLKLSERLSADIGIFGASTEEVTAYAAAIADLRLPPERTTTALGRVVGQIKNAGSEINRVTATFRDQSQVANFLAKRIEEPTEAFRILAEQSTDVRSSLEALGVTGKAATLTTKLAQDIEKVNELLGEAKNVDKGIVGEQAQKQLQTFAGQWELFKNNFLRGFRNLGGFLAKNFAKPLLQFFNGAFAAVDKAVQKLKRAIQAAAAVLKGEFREAARIFSGEKFRSDSAKLLNPLIAKAKELRSIGLDFAKDDKNLFFNQDTIKGIDAEIEALKKEAGFFAGKLGLTFEQTQAVLANFVKLQTEFKLAQKIDKSNESLDRFLATATKAREVIRGLNADISDQRFEISIFNLSEIEQDIRKVARSINNELTDLIEAGDILSPEEMGKFRKELANTVAQAATDPLAGAVGKIDPTVPAREIITQLDDLPEPDFAQGERYAQKIRAVAEALATNEEVIGRLQTKRNLDLEKLLLEQRKNLEEEKKNIASKTAPALAAITDAGRAAELLNEQRNNTDLQKELLAVAEEELEKTEELVEEFKQQRIKVVTRN
jgi:TP901 family phage tail tape measure protein